MKTMKNSFKYLVLAAIIFVSALVFYLSEKDPTINRDGLNPGRDSNGRDKLSVSGDRARPEHKAVITAGVPILNNVANDANISEEGLERIHEPATMLLLGFGLLGLSMLGRRKFFKRDRVKLSRRRLAPPKCEAGKVAC